MATTTNFGITLVEQSQSQKEVTVNQALSDIDDLLSKSLIEEASGEYWYKNRLEVTETGLSGASVITSLQIPDRSIVFAVHTRVTTAITGAASFSVGDGTTADKFGSGIGISLDSTNIGVATPTPYFADTDIVLTPAGGSFSSGEVKLVLHYMTFRGPWDW